MKVFDVEHAPMSQSSTRAATELFCQGGFREAPPPPRQSRDGFNGKLKGGFREAPSPPRQSRDGFTPTSSPVGSLVPETLSSLG